MTLNAKIDPPLVASAEGVLRINARPYNQDAITPGAEIFVWTTQRTGGHRLAARGAVLAARVENVPNASGAGTHKELVVEIQTTGAGPLRPPTPCFDRSTGERSRSSTARSPCGP